MKRISLCVALAILLSLPVVCACSAEKQPADPKALFEKKCSSCHKADKAKSKQKTAAEWTETVMRMKNKNGAPINDEETKTIIDHLARNYGK